MPRPTSTDRDLEYLEQKIFALAAQAVSLKAVPRTETWPWSKGIPKRLRRAAMRSEMKVEEQHLEWAHELTNCLAAVRRIRQA